MHPDKRIQVFHTDAVIAQNLLDLGQPAGYIRNLYCNNLCNGSGKVVFTNHLERFFGVLHDAAHNTKIHGIRDGHGFEVDAFFGKAPPSAYAAFPVCSQQIPKSV